MINKHFFKVLVIFAGIILFALVGIFLVSYFDKSGNQTTADTSACENGKVC